MFDLTGKTALVTGASGGIGGAIARAIHAQGGSVALSGTRQPALDALAAELGDRVAVCPADLREAGSAEALIAAAESALGPLAILVNNAGFTRDMLALRMADADWQGVLDVDFGSRCGAMRHLCVLSKIRNYLIGSPRESLNLGSLENRLALIRGPEPIDPAFRFRRISAFRVGTLLLSERENKQP